MVDQRGVTPDRAWAAVVERDRGYDGVFVFAVQTTGIYCRPSCPARRPLRTHVQFFANTQAAEGAGFRSCLRCRPREAADAPAERQVMTARRYIDEHADQSVTLETLGVVVGLSPSHLQRTFKRVCGITPREYLRARRLDRFRQAVRSGKSVTEATYDAGYGSSRGLYDHATRELGMTPSQYRRGAPGLDIRFTVVPMSLGHMLVAATSRGVCAVSVGRDKTLLQRELTKEFAGASIRCDNDALRNTAAAIVQSFESHERRFSVPLDLHGTEFQLRVWAALRSIPFGETRTYTEIAKQVGRPSAVRAVASACASNKTALVVPCHRVVRRDGSAGGYRWGAAMKARLLQRERGADASGTGRGNVDQRFKQMDRNGDGKLTPDEVPRRQQFQRLDLNKDGVVTLEEARKAIIR
ncbi:MAG: bifunctional DNA-binding transcriptional regulator/O6-methylguanine-DNA methyltransferase Ada [Acidobacteriota bacterium]